MRLQKLIAPPRRSGFTLVELLVVIGIIAVLISILLPAMNMARDHANKTNCLSNLHQIGEALIQYAQTWNDRLPNGNSKGSNNPDAGDPLILHNLLQTITTQTFHCPSDIDPVQMRFQNIIDGNVPESPRTSYDFYSIYWFPEDGPRWTPLANEFGMAPLAWDLSGGNLILDGWPNHGVKGGNVVFADAHAEWQDQPRWDGTDWPHPANRFYPGTPVSSW